MKVLKRIRGGALQLVVFIGAILAVMLVCFVLLFHTHNLFDKKTQVQIALWQVSEDALSYAFSEDLGLNEVHALEMSTAVSGAEYKARRGYWGLFDYYELEANKAKQKLRRFGLVGKEIAAQPALYLEDNQRPLILAGEASIQGDALLPESGIRPGSISGRGYTGSTLVYGKTGQSQKSLPKIDKQRESYLNSLIQGDFGSHSEALVLRPGLMVKRSFDEPTLLVKGHILELRELELSGNLILWAADRIVVDASAQLKDVILVAPRIEIKDWVKGRFQAIATKQIHVGKKSQLTYPSALWVHSNSAQISEQLEAMIYMDSYSLIQGTIGTSLSNDTNKYRPQIKIDENASVLGEVICSGNLELKGSVNGSVSTSGFLALENGSIYQNHFFDGSISQDSLARKVVGIVPAASNTNKKVMQWLY